MHPQRASTSTRTCLPWLATYNPTFTGDWFGRGLAVRADRLAIGAPYHNALTGGTGSGYVVIYGR